MIKQSRVLAHPSIIWIILKNTPTLDPLVILLNSKLYYIEKKEKIVSFLTIKEWKDSIEIGTVYTSKEFRNKGLAGKIIKKVKKDYNIIWLLCKENIVKYYQKQGFRTINYARNKVGQRQRLFNNTIGKILRYKIKAMSS